MSYSYDRRAAERTPISMGDLQHAYTHLKALAKRYEKLKGVYRETPAAPDTSKFMSPQYGDISAVLNGSPRSYLLLGLTVGSTWGLPANLDNLDRDARHDAYAQKFKLLKEVFAEATKIIKPVAQKYNLVVREQDGSAYDQIGIEASRDMNLVP